MTRRLTVLVAAALLLLAGCPDKSPADRPPGDAGRSPNATLRPAPRSSAPPSNLAPKDASYDGPIGIPADSKGRLRRADRDAGMPAPTPLVPTRPLPSDHTLHKELQGVTLEAAWRWDKVPAPAGGGKVNRPGIKAAREATHHSWQIELLESGRMRVLFDAPALPLTKFSELRARDDRFGHILVWPNNEAYRIVPPGALRALLDERRIDVAPLVTGRVIKGQSGRPRFGFPTRKTKVTTPWGAVELEQARTVNVGAGGMLLCRLLLELVSVQPETPVCEQGKVPVHARFDWKNGGNIEFDVGSLLIRTDFPSSFFMVPPPGAKFTDTGLPPNASGIFLDRSQLMAFRTRGADAPQPRTDPASRGAPGEGFVAVNRTDALRFVLLDGVPVAWVPAHGQQYVIGPRAGRYNLQWRSFLGVEIEEPFEVLLPARITLGEVPGAGAGPGAAGAAGE
ncbi:MAG: hypothetical protein ACOC1F_09915 [Myxococcota bacterium]